jgi:hypothetical protein
MKEADSEVARSDGERPGEGAEGGKQRWPRRRLLRWALGLVPVVAGGGWATFEWLELKDARTWAERWTQEATWLCFARHPDARRWLEDALNSLRSYAPARLMYACWYMEQGEWGSARQILSAPWWR